MICEAGSDEEFFYIFCRTRKTNPKRDDWGPVQAKQPTKTSFKCTDTP